MDVGYGIQAAVNEGQDEHNALLQDFFFSAGENKKTHVNEYDAYMHVTYLKKLSVLIDLG